MVIQTKQNWLTPSSLSIHTMHTSRTPGRTAPRRTAPRPARPIPSRTPVGHQHLQPTHTRARCQHTTAPLRAQMCLEVCIPPPSPSESTHCCPSHQFMQLGEEIYSRQDLLQPRSHCLDSRLKQRQTCNRTQAWHSEGSGVLTNSCRKWQTIASKKQPPRATVMARPTGHTSPHLHPRPQSQPDAVKRGRRGAHRWRQSLEGGRMTAMTMDGKKNGYKNFCAPLHAPTVVKKRARLRGQEQLWEAVELHRMQPLPLAMPQPARPTPNIRRPESKHQLGSTHLVRRRQRDRGPVGVRTHRNSPPHHSRQELPTQRREGIRSLVVGAVPPRIPPAPYRKERA